MRLVSHYHFEILNSNSIYIDTKKVPLGVQSVDKDQKPQRKPQDIFIFIQIVKYIFFNVFTNTTQ